MIRGKLILLYDNNIYSSGEFNGDMSYNNRGKKAIRTLEYSIDLNSFKIQLNNFNDMNFGYPIESYEVRLINQLDIKNPIINLGIDSSDYIHKWFSDYLYIKNYNTYPVIFNCINNEQYILQPNTIAWFRFGKFENEQICLNINNTNYDKNNAIIKEIKQLLKEINQKVTRVNQLLDNLD